MLPILLVLLGVAAVGGVGYVTSVNNVNKAENQIEEAYSTMDVYLKKRHDLIPNLVNTVKASTEHETELLKQITQANNNAIASSDRQAMIQSESRLDDAVSQLFNMASRNPQLSSNQNFMNLMDQLKRVEDDIANSRKYFNAAVRQYNDKLDSFPGSFVAKNKKPKAYFQVSSQNERENVDVDF